MDFSTLYTQLVLRDLIGYIGPGSIVCVAVAVILLGGPKELLLYLKDISGLAWVPAIAIFYVVGLGIQGAAFDVVSPNPVFRYHVLPDDSTFSDRLVQYERALSMAPEKLHARLSQQRERFVALKHATANGSVALLIAGVLILWKLWSSNFRWSVVGLGLALLAITLALWSSHYQLRFRQNKFELDVINSSSSFGTAPSVQMDQVEGQKNK